MNILILILGISSLIAGYYLIKFGESQRTKHKTGGFIFNLQTAGIGLLIIGFGLIGKCLIKLIQYLNQWAI